MPSLTCTEEFIIYKSILSPIGQVKPFPLHLEELFLEPPQEIKARLENKSINTSNFFFIINLGNLWLKTSR